MALPGINIVNLNFGDDNETIDSAFIDADSEGDSAEIPDGEEPLAPTGALDPLINYFRYRQGRRWNRDGSYILPTDKPEVRRLENQHRLCYSILGRQLFLGCVNFPEKAKILDIGCSSGIWALEIAEKYPQATVIGLDISPQQTGQPVPPNCSFVYHDIKERLPFPDNQFDFVHMRDMQSAITVPWDPILKEINRILVPGGFAQFAEFIYHHNTGTTSPYRKRIFERSPVRRMEQQFIQAAGSMGTTLFKNFTITNLLKTAGNYSDPKELIFPVPIGLWGTQRSEKFIGGQMLANLLDGLNSFGAALLQSAVQEQPDVAQRFITEVEKQYRNTKWRMSMNLMYCAVQKVE